MPQRDSDSFTYSNGLLASVSSGKWTKDSAFTDLSVSSNQITGGTSGQDHVSVITSWGGDTGDQWCQVTLSTTTSDGGGPIVRSDGAGTGYLMYCPGNYGSTYLFRLEAGGFDEVANAAVTWTDGDVAYLEIQGNVLIGKKGGQGGTQVITWTDDGSHGTVIASGKPALHIYNTNDLLDNFAAGDFGAPVGDLSGTLGEGLLGRSTF